MPQTSRKPKRFAKRAAIVLAFALILACLALLGPSDTKRSRALKLGMTRSEVEAVMGQEDGTWGLSKPPPGAMAGGGGGGSTKNGICFGKWMVLKRHVSGWVGIDTRLTQDDWPVLVRFGEDDRVNLIRRRGEPREESPSD